MTELRRSPEKDTGIDGITLLRAIKGGVGIARSAPLLGCWIALTAPSLAVPLPVPRPFERPAAAIASTVPLPLPRPEEDGPPAPQAFGPFLPSVPPLSPAPSPPLFPPSSPAPPEPDLACGRLMAEGKVVARAEAPVAGSDGCGIAAPVTVDAIVLRDGRKVPLVPPALMRCDFAETLADWVRDDIVPATSAEGALLGLADAGAYLCRSRNGIAGARISEHARGNAIDILAFRFAKRVVGLKGADARALLASIRASACARFSTVLGPGADAYHETDLHLDLEHRRHAVRLCQWTVE